jgi:hypothetical protein
LDPAFASAGEVQEAGEDFVYRLRADEVGLAEQLLAVPEEVDVGVAEARDDRLAGEVEAAGVRAGEARGGGVVADVDKATVVAGHRGGTGLAVVAGDEVGTCEDPVGGDRVADCNRAVDVRPAWVAWANSFARGLVGPAVRDVDRHPALTSRTAGPTVPKTTGKRVRLPMPPKDSLSEG